LPSLGDKSNKMLNKYKIKIIKKNLNRAGDTSFVFPRRQEQ
jgi:hypothetical protein